MARAHPSPEDDEGDDEESDDEAPAPKRSARRRSRGRPSPVRRWHGPSSDDPDEGEESDDDRPKGREHVPIFWRARDSLYFGPLVALAIVVVLIAALFAFTQNWPPVYVVESSSMQHGPNDVVGLINTGDLVLAEKIPTSSIQTYIDGSKTGYSTYGEYGDVVLYWANGGGTTPIIHRAILYLEYDASAHGYNATSLFGTACGVPGAVYATPGTPASPGEAPNCGTTGLTGTLDLYHVGWTGQNVSLQLNPTVLGTHSGYLTMGDNNFVCGAPNCPGLPDQGNNAWLSQIVEPAWVLGVARGMLPWFGAVKLALEGKTSDVPSQSWQFLGLTIAGLILLALGIHFAFRAEGIEDPRRLEQEEEEAEEDESEAGPPVGESRGRRILRSLRPWRSVDDEEDDDEAPVPAESSHRGKRKAPPTHHGRPHPHVRRPAKPARHPNDRGDEGGDL